MPLPATIVNVNSANYSEHLNSSHKPVQRIRSSGFPTGEDTVRTLGDSATNEAWGNLNVTTAGRTVVMVMVKMKKSGSPSDGVVCKLYNADGGLPGTLLSTSLVVNASQLSTTSRWVRFWFLMPVATGNGFIANAAIFRTGSFDASNFYQIDVDTGRIPVEGQEQTRLSSGSWSEDGTAALMWLLHEALPEYYSFGIDRTNNKLRAYASTDSGLTWAEKDSTNAPSVLSTANFRSVHVHGHIGAAETWIAKINSSTVAEICSFDAVNGTWVSGSTLTVAAFNANVSGKAPFFGFRRNFTSGTTINCVVYQGATETVMGSAFRRIKLTKDNATATYDVIGSANTPNATLPGTQVHHDLRFAMMDDLGNIYIFYTQSDDSLLRCRVFKVNDTFATAINPGSAVTSNSAAYPVGQGCSFWRSNENYISVPYMDGTNTKALTVKAGADAETAGNWTASTIAASAAETATSNPAALVPDNEGGGKLFCFRVRTDDTIGLTDDGGLGAWSAEQDWRSGQTVAGISGGALLNPKAAGITYLDTAPATDELKHDHL